MRNYDYSLKGERLLTPEIVRYLTGIHEYRAEQRLTAERHGDLLAELAETAKIQSVESSNRIEGICTSDERLRKIVMDKTIPQNRSEKGIAGYRDVLGAIHDNFEHIPVKPSFILQLYRDLYKFEKSGVEGRYEDSAAESIGKLCEALENGFDRGETDALLLIPMFVLDFLSIQPFQEGSGRMSRLLTLLLLYRCGYAVGRYISIEKLIEQTKDSYYGALRASFYQWQEDENDYMPFVKYMLGVFEASYHIFSQRTKWMDGSKLSKPDRIAEKIRNRADTITKTEILHSMSDVSDTTVQRTLGELLKSGKIVKIGGGRYTRYKWNQEDEIG